MKRTFFLTATGVFLFSQTALAHPGHTFLGDLGVGFVHPFVGIDHLLAMFAVGLLGAQSEGKARFALPILFVAVMAAGGLLGLATLNVPFMEQAILGSVILLGAVIAFGRSVPFAGKAALVAAFAIFHGAAHGVEMPIDTSILAYGFGMLSASAILHAGGLLVGNLAPHALRYAGIGVSLAGIGLAAA